MAGVALRRRRRKLGRSSMTRADADAETASQHVAIFSSRTCNGDHRLKVSAVGEVGVASFEPFADRPAQYTVKTHRTKEETRT